VLGSCRASGFLIGLSPSRAGPVGAPRRSKRPSPCDNWDGCPFSSAVGPQSLWEAAAYRRSVPVTRRGSPPRSREPLAHYIRCPQGDRGIRAGVDGTDRRQIASDVQRWLRAGPRAARSGRCGDLLPYTHAVPVADCDRPGPRLLCSANGQPCWLPQALRIMIDRGFPYRRCSAHRSLFPAARHRLRAARYLHRRPLFYLRSLGSASG